MTVRPAVTGSSVRRRWQSDVARRHSVMTNVAAEGNAYQWIINGGMAYNVAWGCYSQYCWSINWPSNSRRTVVTWLQTIGGLPSKIDSSCWRTKFYIDPYSSVDLSSDLSDWPISLSLTVLWPFHCCWVFYKHLFGLHYSMRHWCLVLTFSYYYCICVWFSIVI